MDEAVARANMWTLFWDMHSGGSQKLDFSKIYINAPEVTARIVFENRFGRNPDNITCECCGEDYSVYEHPSLEEATAFHRRCEISDGVYNYSTGMPLVDYVKGPEVLILYGADILPEERIER